MTREEIISKFNIATFQFSVYRDQPVVELGERGGVPQSVKDELRERCRVLIREGLKLDGYPLPPVRSCATCKAAEDNCWNQCRHGEKWEG